jgi:hypothetical protein
MYSGKIAVPPGGGGIFDQLLWFCFILQFCKFYEILIVKLFDIQSCQPEGCIFPVMIMILYWLINIKEEHLSEK